MRATTAAPLPSATPGSPPRQQIVPDLMAVVPGGVTAAQVASIGALAGVRAVLAVDSGQVTVNGAAASVLGVEPQALRPGRRRRHGGNRDMGLGPAFASG